MKRTNKKGFTLVELVIVIAIIAILAAVLIPTFSGVVENANQSKALQEAKNAYVAAKAEALADGTITADETIKLTKNLEVTSTESEVEWTFTFGADEATLAIVRTGDAKYNYTFANGVVSVAKKNA